MSHDVKRAYDSSGRKAGSEATRQRILEAAHDLIVRKGYRGTKIAEIARRADVHVGTVYDLVGRKPAVLRELLEQAISGTDTAVAPEERDYVVALRAEPDPARKLAIYAAALRPIQGRMAPLLLALGDAAATEPEADDVWQTISRRRSANMRQFAADLRSVGGLRHDISDEDAADFVWATNSPEVYGLLTTQRGYTPERYEAWLLEAWSRHLLP